MFAWLKNKLRIGEARQQAERARQHADDAKASAAKADSAAYNAEMALQEIQKLQEKEDGP